MFFLVSVVKVESDKVVNVVGARQRELYYTKRAESKKRKYRLNALLGRYIVVGTRKGSVRTEFL